MTYETDAGVTSGVKHIFSIHEKAPDSLTATPSRPQASNWLSWHTFMGANAGRTFLRPFPSLYNLITGSPGSQDPTLWGLSLSGSYVRRSMHVAAMILNSDGSSCCGNPCPLPVLAFWCPWSAVLQ